MLHGLELLVGNVPVNSLFYWYVDPFLSPSLTLNITRGNLAQSYVYELNASCAQSHWSLICYNISALFPMLFNKPDFMGESVF